MPRLGFCLLAALAVAAFADMARAQEAPASPDLIQSEARFVELEGPAPGERRGVYIWRAPSTPGGVLLPTLYVADGRGGAYVAAARLRGAIETGLIPPIQIVGFDPDPVQRNRTSEYTDVGRPRFRAHEDWVLNVVIPWAERVARASPQQRAIGGYSNGAAFATFMGAAHPDVFIGVLAHSPVAAADTFNARRRAERMRWALSAGRLEYRGYPARAVEIVGASVRTQGALVRTCTGTWGHAAESWIELSPGAIAWIFGMAGADEVATPLEREACQVSGQP